MRLNVGRHSVRDDSGGAGIPPACPLLRLGLAKIRWRDSYVPIVARRPEREILRAQGDKLMAKGFVLSYYSLEKGLPLTYFLEPLPGYAGFLRVSEAGLVGRSSAAPAAQPAHPDPQPSRSVAAEGQISMATPARCCDRSAIRCSSQESAQSSVSDPGGALRMLPVVRRSRL